MPPPPHAPAVGGLQRLRASPPPARGLGLGLGLGDFFGALPPPAGAPAELFRGPFRLFCFSSPLGGGRPGAAAAPVAAPGVAFLARGAASARLFLGPPPAFPAFPFEAVPTAPGLVPPRQPQSPQPLFCAGAGRAGGWTCASSAPGVHASILSRFSSASGLAAPPLPPLLAWRMLVLWFRRWEGETVTDRLSPGGTARDARFSFPGDGRALGAGLLEVPPAVGAAAAGLLTCGDCRSAGGNQPGLSLAGEGP